MANKNDDKFELEDEEEVEPKKAKTYGDPVVELM